jgi:elongation factor G
VDVSVALTDGSYHAVDSSDAAFQTAARIAMQEGMPNCSPVLLESIMHVRIHVPNEATAKVNQVVSGRRGQLMGFDARDGWKGWDTVEAQMPLSELSDLIIDLRSLTQGVGTFETKSRSKSWRRGRRPHKRNRRSATEHSGDFPWLATWRSGPPDAGGQR